MGADSEFVVDPTDEAARAERVLEILESAPYAGEDDEAESRAEFALEDLDEYIEWEEDEEDVQVSARSLYPGVYRSTLDEDLA